MRTKSALLVILSYLLVIHLHAQWTIVHTEPADFAFNKQLSVVNDSVVWVLKGDKIMLTTNCGLHGKKGR